MVLKQLPEKQVRFSEFLSDAGLNRKVCTPVVRSPAGRSGVEVIFRKLLILARDSGKQFSSLRFKLIVPYVILTLLSAMVGTYVVTRLVSSSARERFLNQLYEASRVSADGIVRTERDQLADLRLMAFTKGVSDAILARDSQMLQDLLWPLSLNNETEALSLLDIEGQSILTLVVDPGTGRTLSYEGEDFSGLNSVQAILRGETDERGDKFSEFVDTHAGTFLFTGAPVRDELGQFVGALLVGTRTDSLLIELKQQTMADLIFLDLDGQVLGTTFTEVEEGLENLYLEKEDLAGLSDNQVREIEINHRPYLSVYTPLRIREETVGYKAVVLCSEYLIDTYNTSRNVFSLIFSAATMGVILIGFFLSQSIMNPIVRLQSAAHSIAEGDLEHRSGLQRRDEIGQLAAVFDLMTFRLRRRTSQAARLHAETVERNQELNEINVRLQSTQQQLIQSEKLAAVGQLTAGIVHDVKNPLAVIKGLSDELDEDPLMTDEIRKSMHTIRDSATRANRIVSDLLTFARQSTPMMLTQNLVETVRTALRLTEFLARKGRVQVETDFPEQGVICEFDPQQIEQVLINLFQNAIQAMPDGGNLHVAVRNGSHLARISVRDTGIGISADNMRRIFDPFFTTKQEGEGTGLGLSVSYGIISRHGGKIEVESKPGNGTVFTVMLPCGKLEGERDEE
jgi:signal transduction histidine kinase